MDLLVSPLDEVGRRTFLRPVASGIPLLTGQLSRAPEYCIDLTQYATEREAQHAGAAFAHLKKHVYTMVRERARTGSDTHHYERWLRTWWQPREPSHRFFSGLQCRHRMVVCSSPQARPVFVFLSMKFVPTNTLQVFAYDDDYSFGIIQSRLHWDWLRADGGKLRADICYTSRTWRTFPWPQQPSQDAVITVAQAARDLRQTRRDLMDANDWSLRQLYQAAEIPGPHPLKEAQARLDEARRRRLPAPRRPRTHGVPPRAQSLPRRGRSRRSTRHGPRTPAGSRPEGPALVEHRLHRAAAARPRCSWLRASPTGRS